jgi:hypothetical protein
LFGGAQVDILEVEALGIGVALHGHAVFRGGVEDAFHVVVEGIAAQHEAARGMSYDLRVGIFDGGQDTVGHFGAFHFHVGVDGGDHYVELG